MKIIQKIDKWIRVTFFNECSKCDRIIKYKRSGSWFYYKCKCGNKGFGHSLTDREL